MPRTTSGTCVPDRSYFDNHDRGRLLATDRRVIVLNEMIFITSGLLDGLLSLAATQVDTSLSVPLIATPATDLDVGVVPEDSMVFTDFYLPDSAASVSSVFGVDLGTPTVRTDGRFISHPDHYLGVSVTDDLHQIMIIAVPPWDHESVGAFSRDNTRVELSVIDVDEGTESIPE